MKCLLCSLKFDDEKELLKHYISFHKIDESNWFFKNLFNVKKNSKILKKCLRCEDFIYDKQAKVEHDFLNHFSEGKFQPFESKSIDIRTLKDKITIYSIEYSKHKNEYNFFDSEKCVSDFYKIADTILKTTIKKRHLSVHLQFRTNKIHQLKTLLHRLILDIGQHQYTKVFFLMTLYISV